MSFFSRRKHPPAPVFQSRRPPAPNAHAPLENLVIFLGHHKVGSTSLQDFFARHAIEFAKQGVLYPFVDFEGAAHFAAQNIWATPPQRLPLNVREPHNALAFAMLSDAGLRKIPDFHLALPDLAQMRHALKQQLAQIRPHSVVLVSEVFANFGAESPEFAENLARLFPAQNVTLYACFRRIDDYLVAWHGQRLKFGHKLRSLQAGGATDYFETIHFDYRKTLHGWREAFPEARFVLRRYEDLEETGGLVPDFLMQSGLDLGAAPTARRMNISLHPALHDILRRGLIELSPYYARELRKLLLTQTPKLGLPPRQDIEMFGTSQRKEVVWRFSEIDQALGKLVDRDRFFDPSIDRTKLRPIPEREARADALARLCAGLPSECSPDLRAFLCRLQSEL